MGLFDALSISASGLSAERLRMDVTAENLANAQSTQGAGGQPYRRKEVVLQATGGAGGFQAALAGAMGPAGGGSGAVPGGVQVAGIVEDAEPGRRIYDPGHPDADAQGYVTMPNVDSVTEMVDLISESRAYEANVTAMQTAKQMFTKTLDLLR
ncbi:flagellar basal body rod protein FlgC [Capillimicrobium parvum]|uniref:Flagellar basal-body rod protein FlgC n=1 Tax=Capillimicrobium parvum TaxID=2884022 RepID=A0A9E7BW46_9ACTN|nr:flagellar basal body rod protein FlgC [Capillimicrobium parvum]UGS33706.1 Flagellar basal-body rod protein FlgC [Capillimicrobium parvum]